MGVGGIEGKRDLSSLLPPLPLLPALITAQRSANLMQCHVLSMFERKLDVARCELVTPLSRAAMYGWGLNAALVTRPRPPPPVLCVVSSRSIGGA